MKKKNGFTLVELLAVIVVLAIIMIIAIPSVLDVMNNARKSSFVLYAEKVVTAVQTQYVYDSNAGQISGAGLYVYDITQDLNLTSTGSYRGYVVIDAYQVDDVKYYLHLYDDNYIIFNHNLHQDKMPTIDDVETLDRAVVTEYLQNAYRACKTTNGGADNTICFNRQGYQLAEQVN